MPLELNQLNEHQVDEFGSLTQLADHDMERASEKFFGGFPFHGKDGRQDLACRDACR